MKDLTLTPTSFKQRSVSIELSDLWITLQTVIQSSFLAALLIAVSTHKTQGQELSAPTGPVLLRVEGQIAHKNDGERAAFDREMLEGLPQEAFTTSTIWSEGKKTFSGPSLQSVMDAVGASGTTISAFAVNDYKIDIPISTLKEHAPIIATKIDGESFGVRDNGPLWVVYPYDSSTEYQSELIYSRSIWQLIRIVISD